MGRKVFISFLGTNNYVRCNYYFGDENDNNKIEKIRFVQEAFAKYLVKDWTDNDRYFVFLTKDAKEKNWEENGQKINEETRDKKDNLPLHGLKKCLDEINPSCKIEAVTDIPNGNSEDEIWEIFDRVSLKIEENDEIYFDITHGFRSLPMLGMVLINYLKAIKKISVGGIYYGAFETLGFGNKVKGMDLEERNAPIIDLTVFHSLQEWALGAENFVKYGITNKISEAIDEWIRPLQRTGHALDKDVKMLDNLKKSLNNIYPIIATNRGLDIISGDVFTLIKKNVNEIESLKDSYNFKALTPLLSVIKSKIDKFVNNDITNGFYAVDWSIKHGMIQQGITILQETLVSYFLYNEDKSFWENDIRRTECSSAISSISDGFGFKSAYIEILNQNKWEWLIKAFGDIKEVRNDVNHFGIRSNPTSPANMVKRLRNVFNNVIQNIDVSVS